MTVRLTLKALADWAGPRKFEEGRAIFERGAVQDVVVDPPLVQGSIALGHRSLTTSFRLLSDGHVESRCPCYENQERGLVCAHVVALGLALHGMQNDPELVERREAEARRARRLASVDEGAYLRRARPGAPDAVPGLLRLTLARGWRASGRAGSVALRAELRADGRDWPLDAVPAGAAYALSEKDEALLFVLEDIAGGPAPGRLEVAPGDFLNLLGIHGGKPLYEEGANGGAAAEITVNAPRMASALRVRLDETTGELVLRLHTELPFAGPDDAPTYVTHRRAGWVFAAGHFWPLADVLPEPLQSIYAGPMTVPRLSVPRFLQTELPALQQMIRVEADISADLLAVEKAEPAFRLAVRGSPASLSAVLYAAYDGTALVAGKVDPAGQFAIPDPSDILRYTVRHHEREADGVALLDRLGFHGAVGDALSPVVGLREVLNFLGRDLPALRRRGWKVELQGRVAAQFDEAVFVTPVVRITQPSGAGWFEVDIAYEDTRGRPVPAADVQRALLKGDSFVERDGAAALFDAGAIEDLRAVFADCQAGEGQRPGSFRLAAVYAPYVRASLAALDGVDVEAGEDWNRIARRPEQGAEEEVVAFDAALEACLRPYQRGGVRWLRFLERGGFAGILADEMGLGKTVQALAWLQLRRLNPEAAGRPALVVCPTSLVENWAEEAARFTPGLRVEAVSGADRHERWDRHDEADLLVTSYALLRRDIDRYVQRDFSAVILDEAQHIKNRSTQNAIAAKRLPARHRLVLTGTPVENGVSDLWSIMDFLMPGYLGRHDNFRERYERPIAEGGEDGRAAQTRLRRKLHPFLLRRLKRDVARDLPPKIERRALCHLTPDQDRVYREWLESSRRRVADLVAREGFDASRMEVLKVLLRLRQICCHLDLLPPEDETPRAPSRAPSAKMDLLFELLDEALDGGHRVLLFSQFVSMLTILRRELESRDLRYCYLDGSTKDRLTIVKEFNQNREIPIFLISLKAGGTGLNLTGADMVVHYDPWWNPAVEDQATDRAYRIGQKRTVYSVKLITRDTVEEKVVALQRRKQAVIDATVSADEDVIRKMSWEDIREILDL